MLEVIQSARLVSKGTGDDLRGHAGRQRVFPSYLLPIRTNWSEKEGKGKGKKAKLGQEATAFDTVTFTFPESLPSPFKITVPVKS